MSSKYNHMAAFLNIFLWSSWRPNHNFQNYFYWVLKMGKDLYSNQGFVTYCQWISGKFYELQVLCLLKMNDYTYNFMLLWKLNHTHIYLLLHQICECIININSFYHFLTAPTPQTGNTEFISIMDLNNKQKIICICFRVFLGKHIINKHQLMQSKHNHIYLKT